MSRAEFLDWVRQDGGRWEFDGHQPVGMTGGSADHATISENIRYEVGRRLRGGPCRIWSSDGPGVSTEGDRVRFPEATVFCGPFARDIRLIPNPLVVFEVVSPGSVRTDLVHKVREYQLVPSIRSYVVVEQTAMLLTVHSREDSGPWTTDVRQGGEMLAFPEIGIELPIADLYAGTELAGPGTHGGER